MLDHGRSCGSSSWMVGTGVTETNAMGSAEVVDCLTTRPVAYSLFKPAFMRQQLRK
jgi:hypothetical protein